MSFKDHWKRMQAVQPDEIADWLKLQALRERNRKYAYAFWIAFVAFITASTVSSLVDNLVPEAPEVPPLSARQILVSAEQSRQRYKEIMDRDLFSSSRTIPDEGYIGGPASRTRLPFTLVGTLLFDDPARSIAAIDDQSAGRVFPVQAGDYIADKARVEDVQDYKVIFTNLQSGALEYVDMPRDEPPPATELQPSVLSGVKKETGINAVDDTHYEVRRDTIDKSLANLTQLLQDANAIPNFENGNLNGYKVVQVKPGSMFEQLGIKMGDVISSVNGTPVSDPGKALQLLSDLKNTSQVTLAIRRNGAPVTLNYSLR